jgi:hypothetical protein
MREDPREPKSLPEAPPRRSGETTPVKDAVPTHKQPHERDESVDSQQAAPSDRMKQAHDDVEQGLVDTSRAEATDRTYERNLRSEPQAADGAARPKAETDAKKA